MSTNRLASAFDLSTAALAVLGVDGRILEANPALCTIAGFGRDELVGQEFWAFAAPDDASLDHWPKLLSGDMPTYDAERRYVAFDGLERILHISLRPHLVDGAVAWFIVHVEDRTEQRRAEADMRAAESRFTSAFERAPVGMALVGLDGRWHRVNGALCALVGHEESELLERTFQDITHPDDLGADLSLVQQVLDGRISSYDMEKRFVRADGQVVWTLLSVSVVRDDDGDPLYFVSQVQDIQARKELESNLQHRSMHDALTGLPNRSLLLDRLAQAVARRRGEDETFAVLFVDVDGFKAVNDELGHAAGDEVLTSVGARLSRAVRTSDTVARFGGDEFVVIAELAHADDVTALAGRLTDAVAEPIPVEGLAPTAIGASVGVAVFGHPSTDIESLLLAADADMYRVKRARREAVPGLA